jgi:uncharacterized protein YcbX
MTLDEHKLKRHQIANFPELARYFPSIQQAPDGVALEGTITISYRPAEGECKSLDIPLVPKTDGLEETEVVMHNSPTKAYKMPQKYNDWLSSCLGYEVVLVYISPNLRKVLMTTAGNRQQQPQASTGGWLSSLANRATELVFGGAQENRVTFADCAPYLIASEKSMDDVHKRLPEGEKMDIDKFRPNIIVEGAAEVWEEDFWGELTIGGATKIEYAVHD